MAKEDIASKRYRGSGKSEGKEQQVGIDSASWQKDEEEAAVGERRQSVGTGDKSAARQLAKDPAGFEEWKKASQAGEPEPVTAIQDTESVAGVRDWDVERMSGGGGGGGDEERENSAEVKPLALEMEKDDAAVVAAAAAAAVAGLKNGGSSGSWTERLYRAPRAEGDVKKRTVKEIKSERKPPGFVLQPDEMIKAAVSTPPDGCPLAIRQLLIAAETYLHWNDSNSNDSAILISGSDASRERFDRVMAYLEEAQYRDKPKTTDPPASLDDDDQPDRPEAPDGLNSEFEDLFLQCQQFIDYRLAAKDTRTRRDISDLWLEVWRWWGKLAGIYPGRVDGVDTDMRMDQAGLGWDTHVDGEKIAPQVHERKLELEMLLRRIFAGFSRCRGLLKSRRASAADEVLRAEGDLALQGPKTIYDAIEESLLRVKLPSSRAYQTICSILGLIVLWVSAICFVNSRLPCVSFLEKTHGAEEFEPFYRASKSRYSCPSTPDSSLAIYKEDVQATADLYNAGIGNITTAITSLSGLTGNYTSEMTRLALSSVLSSSPLASLHRFLHGHPHEVTQEAITYKTKTYLDELGALTAHIPSSRRSLLHAYDNLDAHLADIRRKIDNSRRSLLARSIDPFWLWGKLSKPHTTDAESKYMVEQTARTATRVGEGGLFKMYDDVQEWESAVREMARKGRDGEQSWWKVSRDVTKADKI